MRTQLYENSGLTQFKEDALAFYDMVSGDKDRKSRRQHMQNGALRSGEGMPDEQAIRQRKFEERQKLDELEEAGEYVTDLRTSKKQFEYWKEKMADKRTFKQDERFDFVAEDTVTLLEDIGMLNLAEIGEGRRQLSAINDEGELIIHRLDEPYPTECYNHGQMAK